MKKSSFWIAGLALVVSACQSDETLVEEVVSSADDANFTISLSAPDALSTTRSYADGANSANGGITNVDMTAYDLRYQLAVYRVDTDEDDNVSYVLVVAPQMQTVDSYQQVTYSLRLTPDRTYKFVAWADFVEEDSTDDLHYDTGSFDDDGQWLITCLDDEDAQLNDESRDAYFVTSSDVTVSTNASLSLELKRPFAKLRLVTTDWNYGTSSTSQGVDMPDNFKVTYYGCSRFTNLNVLTGVSASTELSETSTSNTTYTGSIGDTKEYSTGYDETDSYRTLTVDYLMTSLSEQTTIHFTFEALDGTETVNEYDFSTDIPIQRNYLTTIIGDLLTTGASVSCQVNEIFTAEKVYYTEVSTITELELALSTNATNITLTADITDTDATLYVYPETSSIDLNDCSLTVNEILYYGDSTADSGLTISNGTITTQSSNSLQVSGNSADLTLDDVTLNGYYNGIIIGTWGTDDDETDYCDEGITVTITDSEISANTVGIYLLANDVSLTVEGSEISTYGVSVTNLAPVKEKHTGDGDNIEITGTTIYSWAGPCIDLYSAKNVDDKASLYLSDVTLTSEFYNTIELSNSCITIDTDSGIKIINGYSITSSSSASEYTGNGIALMPTLNYEYITGNNASDQLSSGTAFEGTFTLEGDDEYGITYQLTSADDYVDYVLYYNGTEYVNFTDAGYDDGANASSTYSYTSGD